MIDAKAAFISPSVIIAPAIFLSSSTRASPIGPVSDATVVRESLTSSRESRFNRCQTIADLFGD
jgi:hypothetical protein